MEKSEKLVLNLNGKKYNGASLVLFAGTEDEYLVLIASSSAEKEIAETPELDDMFAAFVEDDLIENMSVEELTEYVENEFYDKPKKD